MDMPSSSNIDLIHTAWRLQSPYIQLQWTTQSNSLLTAQLPAYNAINYLEKESSYGLMFDWISCPIRVCICY